MGGQQPCLDSAVCLSSDDFPAYLNVETRAEHAIVTRDKKESTIGQAFDLKLRFHVPACEAMWLEGGMQPSQGISTLILLED